MANLWVNGVTNIHTIELFHRYYDFVTYENNKDNDNLMIMTMKMTMTMIT